MYNIVNVRRNDYRVGKIMFYYVSKKDRSIECVIYWNIKKILNLFGV